MLRAWGLTGLSVALGIVVPRSHRAGSLRLSPRGPGDARGDYEYEIDRLSWDVYGRGPRAWMPNVTAATKLGAGAAGVVSQATARIARFLAAGEARLVGNTSAVVAARANSTHGQQQHGAFVYCPQDIPSDDPYWRETEDYDQTHHGYIKCDLNGGCKSPVTNADRVDSLRRALNGTATLLATLGLRRPLLYGGSALGYHRCRDVIPWDVDCDVLVDRSDIDKIHKAVFGEPMNWNNLGFGGWTSDDLAGFGADGIRLNKKTPCNPFEVVDTKTGFMCDVFVTNWEQEEEHVHPAALYTPWWAGTTRCPGMFPECTACGGTTNCYMFPERVIKPVRTCDVHGIQFACPADLEGYLEITYGSGFSTPDREIATGRAPPAESYNEGE